MAKAKPRPKSLALAAAVLNREALPSSSSVRLCSARAEVAPYLEFLCGFFLKQTVLQLRVM
ncbi:MAG: hypothetical protein H6718_13210 [Polyangiaceae bacterium]|nr:hypothetical protein [Polyangiaceae bacterium]